MNKTRRITILAAFVSLAIVLSILESSIQIPIPIAGVKLGLANIVTILVIITFGYKDAFIVVTLRCILVSVLSGSGLSIFLFSIAGGLLSTLVMSLLYAFLRKNLSILGISIAGSIAHNIGQITVACIWLNTFLVLTYLPVLLVSGVVAGIIVGIISKIVSDSMQKIKILKG